MENVSKYVLRSTRWTALRHNRDYVAYWGVHAGGPAPREPAPFAVRGQTRADLEAARCGLSLMIALDQEFPENLDRTTAVCLVAWPLRRSSSAGRQRARP